MDINKLKSDDSRYNRYDRSIFMMSEHDDDYSNQNVFEFEIVKGKTVWDVESIRVVSKKFLNEPIITIFDVLAWQSEDSYYYCDSSMSNMTLAILLYKNPCKLLNRFIDLLYDGDYSTDSNEKIEPFKNSKLFKTILKTERLKYVLRAKFLSDHEFVHSIVECKRIINKRVAPRIKPKGNLENGLLKLPWKNYFIASIDRVSKQHIILLKSFTIPMQPYILFVKLKHINMDIGSSMRYLNELCSYSYNEQDEIEEFVKIRQLYDCDEFEIEYENWSSYYMDILEDENLRLDPSDPSVLTENKIDDKKNIGFDNCDDEDEYQLLQTTHMINIIKNWPDIDQKRFCEYLPQLASENSFIAKKFSAFFNVNIKDISKEQQKPILLYKMNLKDHFEWYGVKHFSFDCTLMRHIMNYHPDFLSSDDISNELNEQQKERIDNIVGQNKTLFFDMIRQFLESLQT